MSVPRPLLERPEQPPCSHSASSRPRQPSRRHSAVLVGRRACTTGRSSCSSSPSWPESWCDCGCRVGGRRRRSPRRPPWRSRSSWTSQASRPSTCPPGSSCWSWRRAGPRGGGAIGLRSCGARRPDGGPPRRRRCGRLVGAGSEPVGPTALGPRCRRAGAARRRGCPEFLVIAAIGLTVEIGLSSAVRSRTSAHGVVLRAAGRGRRGGPAHLCGVITTGPMVALMAPQLGPLALPKLRCSRSPSRTWPWTGPRGTGRSTDRRSPSSPGSRLRRGAAR